jgi:catechol 2,3-dioxygenase-like lactoylglutathione lyase family enzyme
MAQPLPINAVHHISHLTHDLEASIRFYCEILGFAQIQRPEFAFPGAWLFNYGVQIHLIDPGDIPAPESAEVQTRTDHIAYMVTDIDASRALLEENGIEYRESYVPATDVTQIFFCDPDGNHIELGCYPPTPAKIG